jgi:RNA polymerase sigma-70 factor (ECF subfamily)
MKACQPAHDQRNASDAASEAMERYVTGEEAAFAELYALVVPRLFGYLVRRTRDSDVARDLMQQTLLVVHRERATYLRGADIMPWLFAIARRLFIDHARKASRDALRSEATDVLELPSRADPVDDLIGALQLASRVEVALAGLPEPQRRAFELLKRRGLSLSETAAALEITVGAVKLRIHRAHRTLRAALLRKREML